MNPRYWDLNCISETFLAAGITAWPPRKHFHGVLPAQEVMLEEEWSCQQALGNPRVLVGLDKGARTATGDGCLHWVPWGMRVSDKRCWQGCAVQEEMLCLKMLSAMCNGSGAQPWISAAFTAAFPS